MLLHKMSGLGQDHGLGAVANVVAQSLHHRFTQHRILCAYGHEGPWQARRGYDTLVQTATGIALEEGAGGPPQHTPVSLLDYATGFLAAFGAMTALSRRAREGAELPVLIYQLRFI